VTLREVPLAAPPIIRQRRQFDAQEARAGIAPLEFEEGRHCSIAGQQGVGIETIREPLDLQGIPRRRVDSKGHWPTWQYALKKLVFLTGEQAPGRLYRGRSFLLPFAQRESDCHRSIHPHPRSLSGLGQKKALCRWFRSL
jgi:hypothetical protein